MENLCSKLASYIAKHSGNKYLPSFRTGSVYMDCMFFTYSDNIWWRSYKKYRNCAMLSVSAALIGVLPLNFISIKPIIEIIIIFLSIYIMVLFAPSRTPEESDASESYRNQCWKEFMVLSIVVCSYIISFLCNSPLHFVIFRSLLTAALSFIISFFQNDRI